MPDFILNIKTNGTESVTQATQKIQTSLSKMKETAFGLDELTAGLGKRFVAGATAAGVVEFFKGLFEGAEKLEKLSRRTRGSVDFLSDLQAGAKQTGVEVAPLVEAFESLGRAQGEFQAGIGRSAIRLNELRALGFTPVELRVKSTESLFRDLIHRMEEGMVTTQQFAAGIKLLGSGFGELGEAAEKGLGKMLGRGGSTLRESNQELLATANNQLTGLFNGVWGGVKKVGATAFNAAVTGIGGFGAGSALNILGGVEPIPGLGWLGRWANRKSDDLLTGAMQSFYPPGRGEVKRNEKILGDKEANRSNDEQIEVLTSRLQAVLGEDADDVIEELKARGAGAQDYVSVLRRAHRVKDKEARKLEHYGSKPDTDKLRRIGLFGGENSPRELRQLNRLQKIEEHLKVIRGEFTAE